MITLDYRTDNPRWGLSSIKYSSWGAYAFALGYLSNELHYRNINNSGLIDLHFESNDAQGAWGKEGRIHYYGGREYLSSVFTDWYNAKSAGVNNITYRINSNDYMYSLVYDFGFKVQRYVGYTTADIIPPKQNAYGEVWNVLENYLVQNSYSNGQIEHIHQCYIEGWNE